MQPTQQGPLLDDAEEIARLNDTFRRGVISASFQEIPRDRVPGRFVVTQGFSAQPVETQIAVLCQVRAFTAFTPNNDPYGEHDFGSVEYAGQRYYWKIDYYDADLKYGSENPADPAQTTRVMTVMLQGEY